MGGGFHASVSSSAQGTSGNAIASLVLGIAGFVIFPLIPSVLAIILGHSAKKDIENRPGLGGEGMATAGVILGWIGVGVTVLGILAFVFLAASINHSP